MKLATVKIDSSEEAAIVFKDKLFLIRDINDRFNKNFRTNLGELLSNEELDGLNLWYKAEEKRKLKSLEKYRKFSENIQFGPLYRHPKRIWGIGLNYVEHASDLSEKTPSSIPASFMKAETTIIGHNDEICIPKQSNKTTGEAELGKKKKKRCKNVEIENWLDVVAGFTTIIDMTAEDILRKNPRYLTLSKNFDTFFSFGPLLITPDEIQDILDLSVATVHNGKVHAKNYVSNMTFPPDFLVSFHSKAMTLLPGDIISTGTPRATHIQQGDIIECQIDGFIPLKNSVRDQKIDSKK